MSEEVKRSRRRRRPRHSSRNKAKSTPKAAPKSAQKATQKTSSKPKGNKPASKGAAKGAGKEDVKAAKSTNSERRSSSSRRGRRRRSSGAQRNKARNAQTPLTIQRNTEKSISPINKGISIYSYTLRPRSLLDSYKAGPNIAEKMAFEQSARHKLDD